MSFLTCNGQGDGSAESQGCFPLDAHRLECFGVAGVRFTATRPCDTLKRGSSVHALKQSSQPSVPKNAYKILSLPQSSLHSNLAQLRFIARKRAGGLPPLACNRPLVSKTVPTQLLSFFRQGYDRGLPLSLSLSLSLSVYSSSLLPLGVYRGLSPCLQGPSYFLELREGRETTY